MKLAAIALALTTTASSLPAQSLAAWEQFDFAHKRVDSAEVEKLPLPALRSLRGIVFGRHGRPFTDEPDVRAYLKTRPWYHEDAKFSNARLSATDKANIDVIRRAEAHKHPQIETGDMRFYQDRVVTVKMLGHHKHGDWDVLTAEIGALHGERFDGGEADDTDAQGNDVWYMQRYFDDRYWYRGRKDYGPAELSAIERANRDTITLARMKDLGYGVAPGMMYLFQSMPLTDSLLQHQSLYALRLLRNEVYARHGRRFDTPWLREYFSHEPWYHPRKDFTIAEVSEVEKNNVKLIQALESRRHEEISTRKLGPDDVDGLFPEIARRLRNEIFARHGRVFRDPRLQAYFASMDWYHPDPTFNPISLTPIERGNVQTILGYEARARLGERFTSG